MIATIAVIAKIAEKKKFSDRSDNDRCRCDRCRCDRWKMVSI